MEKEELKKILADHRNWLIGDGGKYADLRYADLSYADLSYANLSYANLRYADLSYADLRYADLRYANLRSADLRSANLSYADLSSADLRSADLPSPTMILLCNWGGVSDKLTTEMMRYDAANHPNPEKFDEWAGGGGCPYQKGFQRCANFIEKRELWKQGKSKSARELVLMLFKEKGIKYSEGI